jgi:hypothetical protein
MKEFVRELGRKMQRVKSGLKKERETILGGHTPHCLSSTENELIPLLVGLVSAGADASGTLDRQLDLKEFKTLMSFLKVVMCKGYRKLEKLSGVSGPLMTTAAWTVVLEKTAESLSKENEIHGKRDESSAEEDDEDSDEDGDADSGEDSDEDDGECLPRLR